MKRFRRTILASVLGLLTLQLGAQITTKAPAPQTSSQAESTEGPPKTLTAIDQFGTVYSPSDLMQDQSLSGARSGASTCQAGHFTLCFQDVEMNRNYGFDDPITGSQRRNIVCQVFSDLSQLVQSPIGAGGVRINVAASEGTDPNGFTVNVLAPSAGAVASVINIVGFPSGITHSMVWKALVGGIDPYNGLTAFGFTNTSFHGLIRVNFQNVDFHLVNFVNTSQAVPSNELDLYSAVLHEAVHLLGFYSLIDADNNNQSFYAPNGSNGYYSRYDLELDFIQGVNTIPLITYSPPYATAPTNLALNNAPSNCDYSVNFNGNTNNNQPVYMPGAADWSGSGLSHLNCDAGHPTGCATNNGYIMNTCLSGGAAQRHLHQREVSMLCDLGYQVNLNAFFGSNSAATGEFDNFEQYTGCSSQLCLPVGQADAASTTAGVAVSIPETTLLNNDGNATSIHPFSFEVLGGNAVGTVTFGSGNFTFTPSLLFSGTAVVRYLPMCNGVPGAFTFIVINVESLPLNNCNSPANACNLICHGDMEDKTSFRQNSGFSISFNGAVSVSSPDFLPDTNIFNGSINPFPFASTSLCGLAGPTTSSNLANQLPNRNYVSISAFGSNVEVIGFPLNQALQPGTVYELTYLSYTQCPNNELAFVFSDTPPCTNVGPTGQRYNWINVANPTQLGSTNVPGVQLCPTYQPDFWVSDIIDVSTVNGVWQRNTVLVTGIPAGTQLEHMLVFSATRAGRHILLDDFTLTPVTALPMDITSTVTTTSCLGDALQISYEICSDNAVNGLTLDVDLPQLGLHYAPGGDFTNGLITNLSIPANGCITVTLNLEFGAGVVPGTTFPVGLNANGNGFCVSNASSSIVNVTRQAISSNPLAMSMVDLTNNGPYEDGDLIDLQVIFTNTSTTTSVNNIQSQLQLPNTLSLVNSTVPNGLNVLPGTNAAFNIRVRVTNVPLCGNTDACMLITSAENACNLPLRSCVTLAIQNGQWPLVQIEANKGLPQDLQEDGQGNVYATGHLVSVVINGLAQTGNSFFLAKIDDCGQVVWARRSFSTTGYSNSTSVTQDPAGDLYISGQLSGAVRFEGGNNPDVNTLAGFQGGRYGYIAKYTEDGDLLWVMLQYNATYSELHEVQFDPNTQDLFVTGSVDQNNPSFFLLYSNPGISLVGTMNPQVSNTYNRSASLLRMTQAGQVTWSRMFQQDGNYFGRYLEFKGKEVVVVADRIISNQKAPTQLLYYTTSGILILDASFYPNNALYHQTFGLSLDQQGNAFVQTTTWPTQETYISKYRVLSSGISPIYHSQPLTNYGSSKHALASDPQNNQVISQFLFNPSSPIGLIVGLDETANTWAQALVNPVIHSFFTAFPTTMTRGASGNIYSSGLISGNATFDLFGTQLQTSSVGFRDFYITRHQYNGGAPAIFNRLIAEEFEFGEALDPFIVQEEAHSFQLYPNPSNLATTLAWNWSTSNEMLTVQVTDISGRLVRVFSVPAGQNQLVLPTGDWVPGSYFVSLQGDTFREVKTLMIQH